ncbi:CPBP family intramembrane metalloprotease [Cryobacterium melibiosiphilum]|uniref:CPBP family intramembrane metalloprotease n=1 Tax=Cryobacterium melibiosiphilum TaxID=995039 RepID=A0A3A5MRS7_9MICO|nr:CPBP family intramembrane glutamic endopeptidase [Cryobacterium melibiosiphilum]RJT92032.1 CPBP family intramembrane metalloprotease [Cryobacterium melibiosiphilum]
MRKLQDTKPIWHALIWIFGYILIVNVGDAVSEALGIPNSGTALLVIVYSLVLLGYLRAGRRTEFYGLRRPATGSLRLTAYYLPLLVLAFFQYSKGLNPELTARAIAFICVLMIGVGFLEELIFRGLLFQAILKKKTVLRAIYIAGITFGLGHLVNLTRGYSPTDQLIQLVAAIAIGIALGYCVAITRSILPGVLFHILFNISGNVSNHDPLWDTVLVGAMIVVLVPYIVYLHRVLRRMPVVPTDRTPAVTGAPATA